MIISMALHASKEQTEQVCERIRELGYKVHSIQGEERVVIGAVGIGDVTGCLEQLEAMPGVESAVRISAPYKFVSKEFRAARTRVRVEERRSGETSSWSLPGPARWRASRKSWRPPKPSSGRAGACCAAAPSNPGHLPTSFREWRRRA